MNTSQTREHTALIDRELDIQADCAFLTVHDTVERHMIETEIRRNRAIVDALDAQHRALVDWIKRDDQENAHHERINARARARAQQLSGARQERH